MPDRPVGRCVGCFHNFQAGACGGCGAVAFGEQCGDAMNPGDCPDDCAMSVVVTAPDRPDDEMIETAAKAMFDAQHPAGATAEHWGDGRSACAEYWFAAARAALPALIAARDRAVAQAVNDTLALLIEADSLTSLILYRESSGLTAQTKRDLDALVTKLRVTTKAMEAHDVQD